MRRAAAVDEQDAKLRQVVPANTVVTEQRSQRSECGSARAGSPAGWIGHDHASLQAGKESSGRTDRSMSQREFLAIAGCLLLVGGGEDDEVPAVSGNAGLNRAPIRFRVGFHGNAHAV